MLVVLFSSTLLTSCYCFKRYPHGNVRFMEDRGASVLCNGWIEGGNTTLLTGYYGYSNTDYKTYQTYAAKQSPQKIDVNTNGLFGIRAEKYTSPFGIIPESIMGLGIDYSYSNISLAILDTFNNTGSVKIGQHRLLAGINFMLAVQPNYITYVIAQAGPKFSSTVSNTTDLVMKYQNPQNPILLDYRIGLGLQYYIRPNIGLGIEGGCFGGAYLKTGLFYWFKL